MKYKGNIVKKYAQPFKGDLKIAPLKPKTLKTSKIEINSHSER